MADNNFNETVVSLFKGMDSFISTKTVVGETIKLDDGTMLLPLVDVSFGVAAGATSKKEKNSDGAGGGMGGKISPNSVLVIKDGQCKLVSVKSTDVVSKVIDMVPNVIDKFKKSPKDKADEKEMVKKGEEYLKEQVEE
ncbi:MAG: GerW family sporulation protein [Lachnospiraceae bacterium]|nr:GerW family sporulation protein [Lachnospiraceae bacterium]